MAVTIKEGSLEAPTRHPLDWKNDAFYEEGPLFEELERVFDLCHGCRRCVSLCNAFPTLFDLVDESSTMEVDGVDKSDYWKVVDQCYLCDPCYQTKCPYIPPHEWNIDFPHLMLRAKAKKMQNKLGFLMKKFLRFNMSDSSENTSLINTDTDAIGGALYIKGGGVKIEIGVVVVHGDGGIGVENQ